MNLQGKKMVESAVRSAFQCAFAALDAIFDDVRVVEEQPDPEVQANGFLRHVSGNALALLGLGLSHNWDLDSLCCLSANASGEDSWSLTLTPSHSGFRSYQTLGLFELAKLLGFAVLHDTGYRWEHGDTAGDLLLRIAKLGSGWDRLVATVLTEGTFLEEVSRQEANLAGVSRCWAVAS